MEKSLYPACRKVNKQVAGYRLPRANVRGNEMVDVARQTEVCYHWFMFSTAEPCSSGSTCNRMSQTLHWKLNVIRTV